MAQQSWAGKHTFPRSIDSRDFVQNPNNVMMSQNRSEPIPLTHCHAWYTMTMPAFAGSSITWAGAHAATNTSPSSGSWPISSYREWQNNSSMSKDTTEDEEWPKGPPIRRWQDSNVNDKEWTGSAPVKGWQDNVTDNSMDQDENEQDKQTNGGPGHFYASPISMDEYNKQGKDFTQKALAELLSSPEYKKRNTMCQLCWSVWVENQCSQSCPECGGFALNRSCPICDGRCGKTWTRDIEMSHSNHLAHWDGECGLPWEQRQGYMMQKLMEDREDETKLAEDFAELKPT